MHHLRSDSLQWLAGLFCGLLGTIMLVHPNQFPFFQSDALFSVYFLVAAALVVIGQALLLVMVLRMASHLIIASNMIAAALLLMVSAMLVSSNGGISGLNLALLALGIIAAPFLPPFRGGAAARGVEPELPLPMVDLLGLVAGLSGIVLGLFLFLPGNNFTIYYNLPAVESYLFGALFFTGGLALAVTALRAESRSYRAVTLLIAPVFIIFPFFAGYAHRMWFASLYYSAIGITLIVFPRLFSPESRFKVDTLYVRLAVILSICVSLPLVLISTLVTHLDSVTRAFRLPDALITRQDLILIAFFAILTVTVLVALRLAHAFVAPLRKLAAAANALAESQADVTLPVNSHVDEVRRLAQAFAVLRDNLAARTAESRKAEESLLQHQSQLEERVAERTGALEIANRRLEALLSALPVSVIITDEQGNIIRQNDIIGTGVGIDTSAFKNIQDFSVLDATWPDTGEPVRSSEWGLARAVMYGATVWNEVMDLRLPNGEMRTIVHSAAPIVIEGGRMIGAVAVGQDISHQRELERISREAARQAHKTAVQIEAIFNALSDSVIVYDSEGVVTQANSQAIALFGFDPIRMSREQIIKNLRLSNDAGQPATPHTMPSAMAQRGESQVHQRYDLANARGRRYTVLASASPVYVGKELIGSVSIWRDVTERERLLEENRRQNELLQTLISQAPAAIAFLEGPDFRYTLYNRAYERIARGKGALQGRSIAEVWPELQNELIPLMENVMRTGEMYSAVDQSFLIERQGTVEEDYFTFTFTPITGRGNKIEGLMILATETTDYVRTHRAVSQEQARFRGLVESMTDIVCTLDENQCFTGLYGRSMEWFHVTQDDVVGKSIRDLLGDQAEVHIRAFEQTHAGSNVVYEWAAPLPDGTYHFQISMSPLWNGQGQVSGAVAVLRDITEMKKARMELEKYAAQLKQSNMELEQFAFIASHDLQEPLRKIRAFGERVIERLQDRIGEEEQDYLNRMASATQRMQRMIDDLLTFSRVTTKGSPFEKVDLNRVMKEVLSDLEVRMERTGGTVSVSDLPTLDADPMQMHQLFQNLIGNGLKYHRPGVPPQVEVQAEMIQQAGDGHLRMKFTDNGIGFDEGMVERIFQPFERLHGRSEYEGTGMGLAICRKIVERHHGSITAHSVQGEGSTFIIELPMCQPNEGNNEE